MIDPPVPSCPELLEVHTRDAPVREPSSASVAEPVKEMLSVVWNNVPVDGLAMVTVGALLGRATMTLTEALPCSPHRARSLSVAVRVI